MVFDVETQTSNKYKILELIKYVYFINDPRQ
jgi:hypothetical protein